MPSSRKLADAQIAENELAWLFASGAKFPLATTVPDWNASTAQGTACRGNIHSWRNLVQLKNAFPRFPPVHKADLESRQRVEFAQCGRPRGPDRMRTSGAPP